MAPSAVEVEPVSQSVPKQILVKPWSRPQYTSENLEWAPLTTIDLSRFDPETKVSRRHARIWLEGETFLVEDLGSVNGTVINDSVRLAPRQPRVLDSGDKLRVGETTLHFLVG